MVHTGNLRIMLNQSSSKEAKIYYIIYFDDEQLKF